MVMQEGRPLRRTIVHIGVTPRQGVGDGVKATRPVHDGEVKPEEFTDPLVLRHGREPLIQHEFEVVMVRAEPEGATPKIGPPMAHCLHQPNQLALICRQLEVASDERPAEESERLGALV